MNPPGSSPSSLPKRTGTIGAARAAGAPPLIGAGAKPAASEPPPLPAAAAKAKTGTTPPIPTEARGSQAAFAPAPRPNPLKNNKALYAGISAVCIITFVVWVFSQMGSTKPVTTQLAEPTAPAEPSPASTEVEAPIDAKTPAEWVASARISAVRQSAGKLIANGRIYSLNEPIPPFNLRWTGKKETELTFVDAAGKEYRKVYGQSFNSDPVAPPPAPETPPPAPAPEPAA